MRIFDWLKRKTQGLGSDLELSDYPVLKERISETRSALSPFEVGEKRSCHRNS